MLKKILLSLLVAVLLVGLITAIGRSFDANKKLKDEESTTICNPESEKQSGLRNMGVETTPFYGPMIWANS